MNDAPLPREGIILAGGRGTRLVPITRAASKQLLPIYDKPMTYYALSVLMLAGIREVLIITTPGDTPAHRQLLGDGSAFGIRLEYAAPPEPNGLAAAFTIGADFIGRHPVCLILVDNIFYGAQFSPRLAEADARPHGATLFGHQVKDPERFGVAEFDACGEVVSTGEKRAHHRSQYAITGLYFTPTGWSTWRGASVPPCGANGRSPTSTGNTWPAIPGKRQPPPRTPGARLCLAGHRQARQPTRSGAICENRRSATRDSGSPVYEEIAWRRGWVGEEVVLAAARAVSGTEYADYLHSLVEPE